MYIDRFIFYLSKYIDKYIKYKYIDKYMLIYVIEIHKE